jgi:S1-C subfamily serine protease
MCSMDVTTSPRRDGSPSATPQARDGIQTAPPRRPRSAAVRTVATVLLAAVSGAGAGALVAHHGSTAPKSDPAPRAFSRIASTDAASIVAAVAPAVVSIRTRPVNISNLFAPAPGAGEGTGVVIRSDGTILTDDNLVAGSQAVTVTLGDGRTLPARIVGRDAATGVAVLKVAAIGLPTARLAASERLHVGDDVVALGDALALPGGPTVSRGVVAALQRSVAMPISSPSSRLTDLLEVTNALGGTNAGGPVVDTDGEVVGIGIAAQNGDRPPGFAIDVVRARSVIDALEQGIPSTNALGAEAIDVTPILAHDYGLPVESGALIASVEPGSAAQRAGLRPDDIVVEFAQQRIATAADLQRRVLDPSVTNVRLAVLRGNTPLTLTVHLIH